MGSFQVLAMEWVYAAPAFLAGLVILYFLKLKRRDLPVSSTFIWKKALEDLRVNSPFQRLRMNLLLILQLIVLAAVLLALSRPVATFRGLEGRDHVILVDRSASMGATDGGGAKTRFQRAIEEATRIVDGLSLGDRAVVVAFDEQAELLTALTDQKGVLREALKTVELTDRRTRLRDAIEVARGLLVNLKNPVLTVISDGRVGDTKDLAVPSDVDVHFVRTGEATVNYAMTSLEVRRAFEGGEASRVFGTVFNGSGEKRSIGVDCFLDQELVASKEVEVGPREQASVVFESPKLRAGLLRLSVDLAEPDALPSDDVAYAVLREKKDVKVLLVTEGNPFLEKGLQEDPLVRKLPDGTVPRLQPSQFAPEDPGLKDFDLIVLDRVEPRILAPGNYVFFDALPPFEGLRAKGTAQRPSVVDWDEGHPVARFVGFGSLDVTAARRVELRKEDRVVVASTTGGKRGARKEGEDDDGGTIPLVFECRDGDRRVLVLAFDLLKTQSWPLKAAFPIFMANVVRWLGGAGRDERALGVRTGEVAELPVPKGATKAIVKDPAGREHALALKPEDDVLRWADTRAAGFYEARFEGSVEDKGKRLAFAANLGSAAESDIAPAEKIELTSQAIAAEAKVQDARRELWKLGALIAFAFLLVEWWVYNRRVFV